MPMSVLGFRGQIGLVPPTPHASSETENDQSNSGSLTRQQSREPLNAATDAQLPTLSHRLRHDSSILAIVLSDECIYAGTHGGQILVFDLESYEKKAAIWGHRGSVLALCLSHDQELLISSGGDRIVNVWSTKDYSRQYCLRSVYDVGDIFCVAYSNTLHTIYFGAQNTTIQWCNLDKRGRAPCPRQQANVAMREDPFFDSRGPGGAMTPRPADADVVPSHAKGGEIIEIAKENVRHFAHYGYVYCMVLVSGVPEASGHEVLITGGGEGVVKVWTLDDQNGGAIEELFELNDGREEGESVLALAIDGMLLYTGRIGGEVDVWDLETRQLIRNMKAHRDDVLTISVGGGCMFSGAVTGYVRKFDRQYQLKTRFMAHNGRVLASALTHRTSRPVLVTGASDNTLAIWDIGEALMTFTSHHQTSNEHMIESLRRFVSYRTISSDPTYQVDCRRGASFLRSILKNFGATTEMLSTQEPYNPVILAKFRGNPATAPSRSKILFYGHYDVVAADNEAGKWITDPFTMEGIDGYLYGRGTSDNKGPIMAALFACAELMTEQALGSDITFLIEGEEEAGSRGFEEVVRANKEKIGHIDWVLVANSYWLDDRIPCLTYGLRGVIHATVQIESSHPDLHSGVDGSSQLDEPLKDLVMLLSSLTGKNGEVKIPGFYDPVRQMSSEEEKLYVDITTALVQRNPDLGEPRHLAASLMRRWREASLTIHRIHTSGPHNATIIPHLAKAALSIRLVPNQEASEVAQKLQEYLQTQFEKLESRNTLSVTIDHQSEAWLGNWTNDLYQTLEEAVMNAWGPIDQSRRRRSSMKAQRPDKLDRSGNYFNIKPSPTTSSVLANGSATTPQPLIPLTEVSVRLEEVAIETPWNKERYSAPSQSKIEPRTKPLYIREGGSIPAIRFLEKEFDAPAAQFPCGQASDSAHLDNERLRLVNLHKSRDIFKHVFRELPKK